ncbi:MAG: MFS transporter [Anaerolineaceae bacterium]|jgi:GPH family glycoside/pentoside/hexuronide:cation symporter
MNAGTKIPTLTKILYGSGDFGYSMNNSIIAALFPIFMMDVVGVTPALAAAALFIGRSWDYINDPLVGYLSDRTRTRWGRRRPWLLFGALPFALTFVLLWIKPAFITTDIGLLIFFAAAYLIYEASATTVYMPYFALTPELTQDYDERTQLTSFRMLFNIIGGLTAYTLPMLVIGSMIPQNADRVVLMAVIFGFLAAAPYLVVFFSVREKKEYIEQQQPKLRDALKAVRHNKPFFFAAMIYLCTWIVIILAETNLMFYIKYVLQRPNQSSLIMGVIFISAIIALPLWNWVSKKGNKRSAYILGVSFWAVTMCGLALFNAATPLWLLLGVCVLMGFGLSAAQVLPWAIIPDAIEWDEYQTGERHEGTFYSLITLMGKVANSLAVPLSLLLLEFTGYVSNAAEQPASALLGIKIVIGPIPAALLFAGILFAVFYPLSREKYTEVVSELEKRRAARKLAHEKPGTEPVQE